MLKYQLVRNTKMSLLASFQDFKLNGILKKFCVRDEELIPIDFKILKQNSSSRFIISQQLIKKKIKSLNSIVKLKYLQPERCQLTNWSRTHLSQEVKLSIYLKLFKFLARFDIFTDR